MGTAYGYVRVSTREQNEDRQMRALHEVQIAEKNIFVDRQSGKDFDRPKYQSMLTVPDNFIQVYHRWRNKEISGVEAAKECNLTKTTFYRWAKEERKESI